nr:MAG TPA: lysin [Caudoviricetes sp.]
MAIKDTHGGHWGLNKMDPGAVGSGYKEADLAHKINENIRKYVKVPDTSDYKGANINQNLANIAANMNRYSGDYHISNHLNAFNKTANGVEVWYWAGDAPSKSLAEKVSAAIAKATGMFNRGAKATTDLYVLRNSVGRTLLIEWGFIDNSNDVKKLLANMDKAVKATVEVLGHKTSGSSSSTGLAKNPKPVTNGKVGDTVKVYDALYANADGAGRSTSSRGKTAKITRVLAGKSKKYLVGNLGWAHPNDLQVVNTSTGYAAKKVGDTVTVQSFATHYQTGQKIASFVKGKKYKIKQVKNVNQSKSKRAYLLENINSWVLEQDVK